MSSKPDRLEHILDETDPTGTVYSEPFSMEHGSLFSLHCVYGGLTGTLTLWQSNIPDPSLTDDTDWVENTDVTFTALSGAGKQFINAGNAAAYKYRVKYFHGSGTGDLDVYANKGEA